MSLWRKRGTSDTVAPFASHDGQNTPKLFKMTAMTDNDLSIKSEDLSIKSWVGLTDEEIERLHTAWVLGGGFRQLCNAIEAKLKEKNT
jgi:hypothetical protein